MAEPDVPADNNAAERSLRHLVISRRKVSGGTRSEQGTESNMTLAFIFLTRPRSKSSRRLPSDAHFPPSLNCYKWVCGFGGFAQKLLLVLGSLLEMVLAGSRRAPESWDRRIG